MSKKTGLSIVIAATGIILLVWLVRRRKGQPEPAHMQERLAIVPPFGW